MEVHSFAAYKRQKRLGSVEAKIVNLPAAPLAVCRTKFEGNGTKAHCVTPGEAVGWVGGHQEAADGTPFTVAIAGPGDPLATPEQSIEIMHSIRRSYPGARFALRSLGLNAAAFARALADAGVEHVELVTDGMDVEALEDVYLWIRPGRKTLPISKSGPLLLKEQQEAVEALQAQNITVCGCVTGFEDTDDERVGVLVESLRKLGVDGVALNVLKSNGIIAEAGKELQRRMEECLPVFPSLLTQCNTGSACAESAFGNGLPKPTAGRRNTAVVSSNGMEVDLHLGHALNVLIYGPREDGLPCLLEARDVPAPGSGSSRWTALADLLSDCFVLLAASAGENPRRVLGEHGIRILTVQDAIEGCVDVLYGGGKKKGCKKK